MMEAANKNAVDPWQGVDGATDEKTGTAKYTSDTARFWDALHHPAGVIEIRAFGVSRFANIQTGYFDNKPDFCRAVADLAAIGAGNIYCTVNPCDPDLIARAVNRMKKAGRGESTKDSEIARRAILPIDIDSIRASGISATAGELREAVAVADAIDDHLMREGWPDPIFIHSGNGCHLHYPIDLPNDDGAREWVKSILESLSQRFDTDGAKVDRVTYNAGRIMRVPETIARKGDSTADRPHRVCHFDGPGDHHG